MHLRYSISLTIWHNRRNRLSIVILSQQISLLVHAISVLIWLISVSHVLTWLVTLNASKRRLWALLAMPQRNNTRAMQTEAVTCMPWGTLADICSVVESRRLI